MTYLTTLAILYPASAVFNSDDFVGSAASVEVSCALLSAILVLSSQKLFVFSLSLFLCGFQSVQ